jgi:Ser/Thr protein kinase RdoA (MazF antagonist)
MDTDRKSQDTRRRILDAVLSGYHRERHFSRGELKAVWLAPPVRHIFLMGFVLEHTAHRDGFHWADDNFLNWHMEWFRHWAKMNGVL